MKPKFPLDDVSLNRVDQVRQVKNPVVDDGYWQISQHEFGMHVDEVGDFYAYQGKEIDYSPLPDALPASVELYLNGSVYGAILHQRQILPIHGSSFVYKNKGILVCGDSGAGKSSLTASFCLNGAGFLTDDITPLLFTATTPLIWALSDRMKLWKDSLQQLGEEGGGLSQISRQSEKFYYPMDTGKGVKYPLSQIFIIGIHDKPHVEFQGVNGVQIFAALRNEIYRWEYLAGMPESEKKYFEDILHLSGNVNVSKVFRPSEISIRVFHSHLEKYIQGTLGDLAKGF